MQKMLQQIPHEIVSTIIDHVDPKDLPACSLISHAYRADVQRKMFHTIWLDYSLFAQQSNIGIITYNLADAATDKEFRRLPDIFKANPTLASYVKCFNIVASPPSSSFVNSEEGTNVLPRILPFLSDLTNFSFTTANYNKKVPDYSSLTQDLQIAIEGVFKRNKNISNVEIIAAGSVPVDIFAHLSRIQSLTINSLIEPLIPGHPANPLPVICPESLTLDTSIRDNRERFDGTISLLKENNGRKALLSFSELTEFIVRCPNATSQIMQSFLSYTNPERLLTLYIETCNDGATAYERGTWTYLSGFNPDTYMPSFTLFMFHKLTTITVCDYVVPDSAERAGLCNFSWIAAILDTLPSPITNAPSNLSLDLRISVSQKFSVGELSGLPLIFAPTINVINQKLSSGALKAACVVFTFTREGNESGVGEKWKYEVAQAFRKHGAIDSLWSERNESFIRPVSRTPWE
ncbi:hypothetical protein CVT24_004696 [Panaeolus cyanescens]|uniref:F-box domain-containing protein n=1 Tax=Panaeolus cyanescens TaxID=181874 RepID=A0A409YSS4_9AGAR|nr:hypothetical protein CVT24_004696 [Panaeolus cyanescens]